MQAISSVKAFSDQPIERKEAAFPSNNEKLILQSNKMEGVRSANFPKKDKSKLNLSYSRSANIKELARNVFHVEEIDLSFCLLNEAHILSNLPEFAKNNPGLKKLNLKGTSFRAETIVKLIMAFPNLEALDLTGRDGIDHSKIVKAVISLMKEKGLLRSIKGLIFEEAEDLLEFANNAKNLEKLTLKCICSIDHCFEKFILILAINSPDLKQFHFDDWMKSVCLTKEFFAKFPDLWKRLEDVNMQGPSCMTSLERYDVYKRFQKLSTLYCTGLEISEIVPLIAIFSRCLEKIIVSNPHEEKQTPALFSEAARCQKLRKLNLQRISLESFDEFPIPESVLTNLEYLKLDWSTLKANHWLKLSKAFGCDRVKKLSLELTGDRFDPKIVVIAMINIANRCLRLESLRFKMYFYPSNLSDFKDLNLGALRHYHLNGVLDSRVKVYGKKDSIQILEV